MKDHFSCFVRCFVLLTAMLTFQEGAASAEISHQFPVRLHSHVPSKAVSQAALLQHLDDTTHVPLTFILPLRNQKALEALVQRIYDPTDQQYYGKYLTPAEFVEQFAPTQEDYDNVIAYVKNLGMQVIGTHSNRTLLNVSGLTKHIEAAFNLRLHQYQTSHGRTFYAPDDDPEIPASIASIIHGIVGLDNHAVWRTYNRQKHRTEEIVTSNDAPNAHPSGPGGGYSPNDLLTAYNLNGVSAKGAGQGIALFELGAYLASDINAYTNYFGLPPAKLTNILVDGGSTSGVNAEVTLDIELAIALAPQSQIYVYEGPNSTQGVLDTYNRIATDNLARQVSTSWGLGETLENPQVLQAENVIFLQMAAHGQTIYAAAGDRGAYDNFPSLVLTVDDPSSQPYVVGVGGTRLTVNSVSGAYINELVWNGGPGSAGGGGVSTVWPLPSWQANVSTVFSKTHRNVPDVSLNSDPGTGYAIYYNGQWTIFGGTSCAAPLWAAFTACVNQELMASKKPVLGFANPLFYALGLGSTHTADFHDITMGNNLYYFAGMGYDNASGWGSFNGANLFSTLTSSMPPPANKLPNFDIAMTSAAPFIRGKVGTYMIAVSNHGSAATSGAVTVAVTLPTGLTFSSLSGLGWSGWTFNGNTLTCTQNSTLAVGSSYAPIMVMVDVDCLAPTTVTSTATVSGGGAASSATSTNLTTIK